MDSEDDMHDANDVDSYEEDYCSGDAMYSDDDDDDDANAGYDFDNDSDDSNDVIVSRLQKNYTILKEDDTCQRQEDDITRICSVLSVTRYSACMLLRRYNWNVSNVHEAWFADEDKVRKAVGLLDKINIMKPPKAGQSGTLAPGCEFAIEFDLGSGSYDVTCQCSHRFCWNCTEEAHRPVDCETVSKWILKNSAEYENMNWILANSKPCLKCKRPIEKNQGCMHMTCNPPCKYEFCWLCLGQWSDHGERTGGFYACNRYESAKQEGAYDEAERRREMAKNSLERYTHYYERWATNQSSRQKALADLQQMQTVHLAKLSEKQCQPETQLKFIIEAWLQIVECRRVLKWTYAYGYYLPELEQAKRQFFEYLQGEAEAGLERLHQCAEKELHTYLNEDSSQDDFNNFRTKLAGLTSVTRNYFENLVRALENGLADVDEHGAPSKSSTSKTIAGTSKSKSGKGKGSTGWSCDQCTYMNPKAATSCQMCNTSR